MTKKARIKAVQPLHGKVECWNCLFVSDINGLICV